MHTSALAVLLAATATVVHAAEPQASMIEYVDSSVRVWFDDPAVQAAIRESNAAHAGLSEDQILELDSLWRGEIGRQSTPTVTPVAGSAVSDLLREHVHASEGTISEIILMDNRGLNVAVSAVTSDFWQGDEAKFFETYPRGAEAVHFGDIELDESSQTFQAQVSFVITDTETGEPIGAATIGLNAEVF